MYASTLKSRFSVLLLAAALLALFTSACGFQVLGNGRVSQTVDIRITEDMLQQSKPRFNFTFGTRNFYDPLLDEVTRVELHDGYIRFVGTSKSLGGRVGVPGSLDLYLGAKDGMLTARIIGVDIPGYALDDPLVVKINQEMNVEFDNRMDTADAEVFFQDVRVTEDELHILVKVNVRF
jgi:hypothetical protein